jgi:Type ISP C-terminal specificity domain
VAEERALSTAYKTAQHVRPPQGHGLNDLYVRFFRIAEQKIVQGSGCGVVCFISNYSWLDGLSFTGMRERYQNVFDAIWIDCLNGDKYRMGKLTPDGKPDPSIFSTDLNREGIQIGTAISLFVRRKLHFSPATIHFRNLWGTRKKEQLTLDKQSANDGDYVVLQPEARLGLAFLPTRTSTAYLGWPSLTELFAACFSGVKTSRDSFLIDPDRETLEARVRKYFDSKIDIEELAVLFPEVCEQTGRFNPIKTREALQKRGVYDGGFRRYAYRPFDLRWIYWDPDTKLLDEKREEFANNAVNNIFIEAREKGTKFDFDRGYVTNILSDNFGNGLSSYFSLYAGRRDTNHSSLSNLSSQARSYLSFLVIEDIDLFMHVVACIRAPRYAKENRSALRLDWPHVPLPAQKGQILVSALLGRQIAALFDPDTPVEGVTTGVIRPELKPIGTMRTVSGLGVDDEDLQITAGWGHAGQIGITMPGRGRREPRPYSAAEEAAIEAGAGGPGLTVAQMKACLGEDTGDVWLNENAYWANVPARVWEYRIGGYQVMKKWLSYREYDLLGRPLKPEEAREVTAMSRRLAALLLLEPALDETYARVVADAYAWPGRA